MIIPEHIPVVAVPASKSVSNRLLMMQHTAFPSLRLSGLSESADTRLLQSLLEQISRPSGKRGIMELDVRNCGTAFRFLLPYLSHKKGRWRVVGSERLRQRPIRPLVELLRSWGADIRLPDDGSLPLEICGHPELHPQSSQVDLSESSQFLSALLLLLPALKQPVTLRYAPESASTSYIRMTVRLMWSLGLSVEDVVGEISFDPIPAALPPSAWEIEGDWSAAAFWWAWAALQPAPFALRVGSLSDSGLQGDADIVSLLEPWGICTSFVGDVALIEKRTDVRLPSFFRMDGRNCLDLVPLLTVLCLLSGVPAEFSGVGNLRLKESDRVEALRENLSPWADVTFSGGSLRVVPTGRAVCGPVSFRSFMDHRIVMALALFFAFVPVSFDNPEVVVKSYPAFWEQVSALRRQV
jgi:3-phosphoshikimate 1-carboxyvinyltransferase